jgi:hypothetical protein
MKEVIFCIFWILSCVGLFIWAGCNIDIASSDRSSVEYRMNNYRNVVIVDKHYDWDLLSDDWYISVKYDGAVRVIEVTKETYMSYQIGDSVFMDILTGKRI